MGISPLLNFFTKEKWDDSCFYKVIPSPTIVRKWMHLMLSIFYYSKNKAKMYLDLQHQFIDLCLVQQINLKAYLHISLKLFQILGLKIQRWAKNAISKPYIFLGHPWLKGGINTHFCVKELETAIWKVFDQYHFTADTGAK